jgi:hypothetical protein
LPRKNVTLKGSKIQIGSKVDFGRFQVVATEDGVAVMLDPKRVEAIRSFQSPTTVEELRLFLGLAGTLSCWSPDYAHNKAGIANLLKKETAWVWDATIEEEFQKVKDILCDTSKLRPYNPKLKLELYTDASKLYGMGYVLV